MTARTPACECPACGYEIDAAMAATEGTAKPKPGDLSICLACASALKFRADLTVELLSIEDFDTLTGLEQNNLFAAMQAVSRFNRSQRK